jgi:hypothetical protein
LIQKRGKLLAHFTIVIKPEFRDLCDLLMLVGDQRIHNQSISWEQEMVALISWVIFGAGVAWRLSQSDGPDRLEDSAHPNAVKFDNQSFSNWSCSKQVERHSNHEISLMVHSLTCTRSFHSLPVGSELTMLKSCSSRPNFAVDISRQQNEQLVFVHSPPGKLLG